MLPCHVQIFALLLASLSFPSMISSCDVSETFPSHSTKSLLDVLDGLVPPSIIEYYKMKHKQMDTSSYSRSFFHIDLSPAVVMQLLLSLNQIKFKESSTSKKVTAKKTDTDLVLLSTSDWIDVVVRYYAVWQAFPGDYPSVVRRFPQLLETYSHGFFSVMGREHFVVQSCLLPYPDHILSDQCINGAEASSIGHDSKAQFQSMLETLQGLQESYKLPLPSLNWSRIVDQVAEIYLQSLMELSTLSGVQSSQMVVQILMGDDDTFSTCENEVDSNVTSAQSLFRNACHLFDKIQLLCTVAFTEGDIVGESVVPCHVKNKIMASIQSYYNENKSESDSMGCEVYTSLGIITKAFHLCVGDKMICESETFKYCLCNALLQSPSSLTDLFSSEHQLGATSFRPIPFSVFQDIIDGECEWFESWLRKLISSILRHPVSLDANRNFNIIAAVQDVIFFLRTMGFSSTAGRVDQIVPRWSRASFRDSQEKYSHRYADNNEAPLKSNRVNFANKCWTIVLCALSELHPNAAGSDCYFAELFLEVLLIDFVHFDVDKSATEPPSREVANKLFEEIVVKANDNLPVFCSAMVCFQYINTVRM